MLVETLLRNALDRGRVSRYRRSMAFESAVTEALEEARLQPFGSPLATARTYAANTWLSAEQRCVWEEAAERIAQGGLGEAYDRRFTPGRDGSVAFEEADAGFDPPPFVEPVAPTFRRYVVRIRSDVGPGSPGAFLRDLAATGAAQVEVDFDLSGEPFLTYDVDASHHAAFLAPLSPAAEPRAEVETP